MYKRQCGRCGRNGNTGTCISIITDNELNKIKSYQKAFHINIAVSYTHLDVYKRQLEVLEEVCPLSARMVVNQVSMKMEQERINKLINDVKKYIETQGI